MIRKTFLLISILVMALALAACDTAPQQGAIPQDVADIASAAATAMPEAADAIADAATAVAENTEETASTAPAVQVPAGSDLTAEEVADLIHMREEEKLARDVYLALYDKWQTQVFQNIASAEQMHMDTLGTLLTTYGIDDPVAQTGDQRGVFVNPDLQSLYTQLVAQGSASLVDALTVGATIEDLDIKDLNEALARTNHADIATAYANLKMGSENHMRAFVSNLKAQGADYTPQFISMDEYLQILAGTTGRGQGAGGAAGSAGAGQGAGQGHGRGPLATATPQP